MIAASLRCSRATTLPSRNQLSLEARLVGLFRQPRDADRRSKVDPSLRRPLILSACGKTHRTRPALGAKCKVPRGYFAGVSGMRTLALVIVGMVTFCGNALAWGDHG